MTARELRNHLRDQHDIPTRGLDWAAMTTLHEYEHQPANQADHNHGDTWAADCQNFGCHPAGAARVAVLEYMVLATVVVLAAWLYVLAGR